MSVNSAYKAMYARAYRYLSAAGDIRSELLIPLHTDSVRRLILRRTKGIISREIKKSGRPAGKISRRFLSALSCDGYICRYDTVTQMCQRVYVLDNDFGLSDIMLEAIGEAAVSAGYDIVCCMSCMSPKVVEHLLIPELSLAFVSQTSGDPFPGQADRHIRLDAMLERGAVKSYRSRIRSEKKLSQAVVSEAILMLHEAKRLHDKLEALYNPHVDFEGVYALAESHIDYLLGLRDRKNEN